MKRCLLVPCPGCLRTRTADEGHYLCRECEGYPAPTDPDLRRSHERYPPGT